MNIVLIGMSGAGKSFIGKRLAENLEYKFIDIDRNIEKQFKNSLQDILGEHGEERFLIEEEREILELEHVVNTVIAPGGSVIYSQKALSLFKKIAKVVYFSAPASWIEKRIDPSIRGIVGLGSLGFETLYAERHPLYEQAADLVLDVQDKEPQEVIQEIKNALSLQ
jgi:shikimate kinase